MRKITLVFFVTFSLACFYTNYSIAGGTSSVITGTTKSIVKKIGKFFSKKPVDKKTGKYIVGGAVVNDQINNNKDKNK